MSTPTFAVCIRNSGYEVSLELRKLYEVLPDNQAEAYGRLRVIDESGEDYLFPEEFFCSVAVARSACITAFASDMSLRWSNQAGEANNLDRHYRYCFGA